MVGVPCVLWDADYYHELYPTGLFAKSDDEMLTHINALLDNTSKRNRAATAALTFARTTLTTDRTMRVFSQWIDDALAAMPKTRTARTRQMERLIKHAGRMSKRELIKASRWGSFPFTPYRRAFLDSGNIVDVGDGMPTYEWIGQKATR